jgi:hypothetical protein
MKGFKNILLKIIPLVFQKLQKIPFAVSPFAAVQRMVEYTQISKSCPLH